MSIDIRIDEEFEGLIPRLPGEVYRGLEENILRNGCLDTIKTWNGVILDGHNRYRVCSEHGIAYQTHGLEFTDRESAKNWMILNQLDRRDLTPEQRSYLRGKLYTAKKGQVGFQDGNQHASKHGTFCPHVYPTPTSPQAAHGNKSQRRRRYQIKLSKGISRMRRQ